MRWIEVLVRIELLRLKDLGVQETKSNSAALYIYTGMRETALTEINLNEIDFENNTFKIID